MHIGDRIKSARIKSGLTQKQLAEMMGFRHNAISNWEHGKATPDADIIAKLCQYLSVSPNELIWGETSPSPASSDFINYGVELLQRLSALTEASQHAVMALVQHFESVEQNKTTVPHKVISSSSSAAPDPIIDVDFITGRLSLQSVAAGTGTYLDEDNFEPIQVAANPLTRRASFFVQVSGNSMEPRYHNGDILIVAQGDVAYGEVGIFTIDNLGYVKVRGRSELISLNPDYTPIPMNDSIICNGKVIGVLQDDWIFE